MCVAIFVLNFNSLHDKLWGLNVNQLIEEKNMALKAIKEPQKLQKY